MTAERATAVVALRRPTIEDHAPLVGLVNEWWGGRPVRHRLPRLWFEHFTSTSAVAETSLGQRIGFAIGFVSPDRPRVGYLHLVGVAPGRRRRGIGRDLVEDVVARLADRGARTITTIAWPGDPIALAFLRSVRFEVDDGPGTRPLYGVPARTDWDHDGDDEAVLTRSI
jgi:ribosomal protein S18 acetylase RimI-like enzyme